MKKEEQLEMGDGRRTSTFRLVALEMPPGLAGLALSAVGVGAALVDELLDGVEDALDTRFVRAFDELPAERVKLVEFVLALIVALVLHGCSPVAYPPPRRGNALPRSPPVCG